MFYIDTAPLAYSDPWNSSFERRFADLLAGKVRIAYFYEKPDNSTFRYRVYNMIQALRLSDKEIGAAWFCNDDLHRLGEVIDCIDVLVICRTRYSDRMNQAIVRARRRGARVLYDVDDFVFNTDYVNLIVNTLDQDLKHPGLWDFWFAYIGRIGALMRCCDGVITTNACLAAQAASFAGLPTHIVPNFLNQEQLHMSDLLFQDKVSKDFRRNDKIHLGYFSGTPSHARDFALATTAIQRVLDDDPRVHLLVVGYLELKGNWAKYEGRTTLYSLHDFVNLQRIISLVEFNLVPLQDNAFTNCKSELKYFEAAVVGTLSIASPIHSYAHAIRDKENGYLSSSIAWYETISQCIADLDRYSSVVARAQAECLRRYSCANQVGLIEQTLLPFL